MNYFPRSLFRKANFIQRCISRSKPFRAACAFCFYRSIPSSQGPQTASKAGLNYARYTTASNDKQAKKNFYKVLGVSPKATQSQIKNAFYKLSLKHHPDRHKGSAESHDKFQEISEAYNVLGNQETRKEYDRELVAHGRLRTEHTYTSATPSSPKKPPESIYDFDEWTRAHYSGQLDRNQRSKLQQEEMDKELSKPRMKIGSTRTIVLIMFSVIAMLAYYHGKKAEEAFFDDQ